MRRLLILCIIVALDLVHRRNLLAEHAGDGLQSS